MGNVYGGKPDCHGSRALLLSNMQGVEPPAFVAFFPHMPAPAAEQKKKAGQGWPSCACHMVPKNAPSRAISLAPVATDFPAHLAHKRSCNLSSHATSEPCPHQGRPNYSRATSGAESHGWPKYRGGDTITA